MLRFFLLAVAGMFAFCTPVLIVLAQTAGENGTTVPSSDWSSLLGVGGASGILVWYLYYNVKVTIPGIVQSFKEELAKQREHDSEDDVERMRILESIRDGQSAILSRITAIEVHLHAEPPDPKAE